MVLLSRLWSEGKSSIGFWKEFDLGTFNDNFEVIRAHGLGHHPALVVAAVENISADLGFTPGQRIWNLPPRTEGNSGGIGLTATETSWKVVARVYE